MDHLPSVQPPETLPSPMNTSEFNSPGPVFRGRSDGSHQTSTGDFAEATYDLLMEDSAAKRAAAAHRLAILANPGASPYLIAALADNSPQVYQAAVQSLGQIGDSQAIAPLQDLFARVNDEAVRRTISIAM